MWKFSLVFMVALSLSGCQQQPPARVVVAKPSIKRASVQKLKKNSARANVNVKTFIPNKTVKKDTQIQWVWPAKGNILTKFNSGQTTFKGIDIGGHEGTPVFAASDGEVVYSGNSLRGYGNLIIIKHQKNFLSAYAHNSKNMVKEGDRVVSGQRIAEMGQTGTDRVKLHFEVRYQGKPIDPQSVLPGK